jgi:hypothetical protein
MRRDRLGRAVPARVRRSPQRRLGHPTVKFTNRASVRLALSAVNVNFGSVDPLASYTKSGGTANVRANANWTLTASAPVTFTEDNGGTNTIPIGRLALGVNGGGYGALVAGQQRCLVGHRHHQRGPRHCARLPADAGLGRRSEHGREQLPGRAHLYGNHAVGDGDADGAAR